MGSYNNMAQHEKCPNVFSPQSLHPTPHPLVINHYTSPHLTPLPTNLYPPTFLLQIRIFLTWKQRSLSEPILYCRVILDGCQRFLTVFLIRGEVSWDCQTPFPYNTHWSECKFGQEYILTKYFRSYLLLTKLTINNCQKNFSTLPIQLMLKLVFPDLYILI